MKKLADTLKQLKRDGYHILFVPMHGPFDQNASRDIINLMGEEAHMLPYKLDIHEKISILSECSLLIGMRLHALILSAVANILWSVFHMIQRSIHFTTSKSADYRKRRW